jgi:ribonuclease T1
VGLARSFGAATFSESLRKLGLAFAMASALVAPIQARSAATDDAVALASLPTEARQTEVLIRRGGPFPYAKDGSVFGNRERQLPRQFRGYYREYTVKTPGGREAAAPEACYYTADHYASFKRIVQ